MFLLPAIIAFSCFVDTKPKLNDPDFIIRWKMREQIYSLQKDRLAKKEDFQESESPIRANNLESAEGQSSFSETHNFFIKLVIIILHFAIFFALFLKVLFDEARVD